MSTLIQLLANYYQSVITSDRIYYDHVNHGITDHRDLPSINGNGSGNSGSSSSRSEKEMLLLQRQVHQLTSELQRQSHENDSLKELQKTQRALMESKLNNCKKTVERLKKQSSINVVNKDTVENGGQGGQLKKREQHLLSPLPGRKLEGVGKTKGLRRALTSRQHTLFDDDDDDIMDGTADRINDVNFVGSIRQTGGKDNNNNSSNSNGDKLAQAIITSDGISVEEEEKQEQEEKPLNKKRKLARKRIQEVNPDSEAD